MQSHSKACESKQINVCCPQAKLQASQSHSAQLAQDVADKDASLTVRDAYIAQLMRLEREWRPNQSEDEYLRIDEVKGIYNDQ